MGFLFGFIGAIGGLWFMSEGRAFFGFLAGMLIGWLLHRLLQAQSTIRSLVDRVDNLEDRNRAVDTLERLTPELKTPEPKTPEPAAPVAEKKIDTPVRVSIFEPEPVPDVIVHEKEPESAPEVIVREQVPESTPRPSMGEHAMDVARRWLVTGNVPVKVGVILSFFGVAFLLKYAVDRELFSIPIGLRYLAIAAFATGLLAVGWQKREVNRVFGLSIQGGGIGVLFLTVFAALRLHELLSPTIAFALLIAITVAAGILAIKQESRALAILGTTGGFLAPLLASTGSGNHVFLFSYYLILNCAILGVALYRPWRELNIIGFVFTFGIGVIWGYQYYEPQNFATVEPFLVLYFLFYTVIAILFALRSPPKSHGYVDGTLIFGTPTIAFALQTHLLRDTEYGLAISAAVVAVFYAAVAIWLRRTKGERFDLLTKSFIALAVAFGTIAIPLALDDRWTAIAWALEGAALVWIGVHQQTTLAKLTGAALAFGGGAEFLSYGWEHNLGIPILNANVMGGVIVALTSFSSAYYLLKDKHGREWQGFASIGLLAWGLAWWFGSGSAEVFDRVSASNQLHALWAFSALSLAVPIWVGRRLDWMMMRRVSLLLLPSLLFGAFAYLIEFDHFLDGFGIVTWLIALLAHLFILYAYGDEARRQVAIAHGWGAIFFTVLIAIETSWQLERVVSNDVWSGSAALLLLAAGAFALLVERREKRWPLSDYYEAYLLASMSLTAIYLVLVVGVSITHPGSPAPLPYIPVLNPLDVLSIVAVLLAGYVLRIGGKVEDLAISSQLPAPQIILAALAWVLSTMSVIRAVHHISGVDWSAQALMASVSVQSSLSIYWAILGLAAMELGQRRTSRNVWMVGAALMAIVVLKLFVIDLGNSGTLARIISFLGVGIMLLVVGYFAPVPPKQPKATED